jgi:predicted DNA binding CopG/RHH family protein
MKTSRKIVNKNVEKRGKGRPRTVSDNDTAPAVAVRLPKHLLTQVDTWAAEEGMKRSDVIREMVAYAIAGRIIDGEKASRRGKK